MRSASSARAGAVGACEAEQGASTSSPKPGTRRRWPSPESGQTSRSCRPSSGGGSAAERGAQGHWRTAIDFTGTIPAPEQLRQRLRAMDTPEPPVACRPLPGPARRQLGQLDRFATESTCSRSRRSTRAATRRAARPLLDSELRPAAASRAAASPTAPSRSRLRFPADAPPRPARPRSRRRPARRRRGPDGRAARLLADREAAADPGVPASGPARRRAAGTRGRPRRRLDRAARAPPLPRLPLERPARQPAHLGRQLPDPPRRRLPRPRHLAAADRPDARAAAEHPRSQPRPDAVPGRQQAPDDDLPERRQAARVRQDRLHAGRAGRGALRGDADAQLADDDLRALGEPEARAAHVHVVPALVDGRAHVPDPPQHPRPRRQQAHLRRRQRARGPQAPLGGRPRARRRRGLHGRELRRLERRPAGDRDRRDRR